MPTDAIHDMPEQLPQLVDIPTLAARLAVGVCHVRRLVAERRIPYVKVGYLVRFEVGAIEAWIEEQTRAADETR